jgi:hypothetical protein
MNLKTGIDMRNLNEERTTISFINGIGLGVFREKKVWYIIILCLTIEIQPKTKNYAKRY